jgi:hypothetical protein
MSLSLTLIRSRTRNRTGLLDSDLADAIIDDAINIALVEFSKAKPPEVYGIMPLVADQQDYAYPDGTLYQNFVGPNNVTMSAPAVTRVKELLFSSGITTTYPFFDKDFPITVVQDLFNVQFGGNVFEGPSLARVLFQKLESFREGFGATFKNLNGNPKKLRLIPTPTDNGFAAYYGYFKWTDVTQIYDEDQEAFLKAVLWKVAEARAMSLAVVENLSEAGGVKFTPAHKFWNDKACDWRDDFLGDVGANAIPLGIG